MKYVFHGMEKGSARRVGDQTYGERDTHGIPESRSGGINMIKRIEQVLEEKVRPALLSHEGDVQIVEYADGVLKIRLTGHCSGCPSARLTTEELIAAEVQKEIPEVKEVVLVNEVSPELLDFARKLLNHDHGAQDGLC